MTQAALPILRTPRLELRPLQDDDADAIVRGVGNYDVSRWLGAVPYPYGLEVARDYLKHVRDGNQRVWGIENAEGLVGTISTHDQLGYWLARPAWRRGYGFEACTAVLRHWFADPERKKIVAGYFLGNERSNNVLRALGFQEYAEGETFAKSLNQEVPSVETVLGRNRWEARQEFTLYTSRLTLRPLEGGDAAAFAALTTPEVTRNLARLKTGMTSDEALADMGRRKWRGYVGFSLAIQYQNRFVGAVGFGGEPSIGYFLDPRLWGQGLMTEALSAFLPEIFERFPVNRINADHFTNNPASGTILSKFGFQATGQEMRASKGRLEPAPVITYALKRESLKVPV